MKQFLAAIWLRKSEAWRNVKTVILGNRRLPTSTKPLEVEYAKFADKKAKSDVGILKNEWPLLGQKEKRGQDEH